MIKFITPTDINASYNDYISNDGVDYFVNYELPLWVWNTIETTTSIQQWLIKHNVITKEFIRKSELTEQEQESIRGIYFNQMLIFVWERIGNLYNIEKNIRVLNTALQNNEQWQEKLLYTKKALYSEVLAMNEKVVNRSGNDYTLSLNNGITFTYTTPLNITPYDSLDEQTKIYIDKAQWRSFDVTKYENEIVDFDKWYGKLVLELKGADGKDGQDGKDGITPDLSLYATKQELANKNDDVKLAETAQNEIIGPNVLTSKDESGVRRAPVNDADLADKKFVLDNKTNSEFRDYGNLSDSNNVKNLIDNNAFDAHKDGKASYTTGNGKEYEVLVESINKQTAQNRYQLFTLAFNKTDDFYTFTEYDIYYDTYNTTPKYTVVFDSKGKGARLSSNSEIFYQNKWQKLNTLFDGKADKTDTYTKDEVKSLHDELLKVISANQTNAIVKSTKEAFYGGNKYHIVLDNRLEDPIDTYIIANNDDSTLHYGTTTDATLGKIWFYIDNSNEVNYSVEPELEVNGVKTTLSGVSNEIIDKLELHAELVTGHIEASTNVDENWYINAVNNNLLDNHKRETIVKDLTSAAGETVLYEREVGYGVEHTRIKLINDNTSSLKTKLQLQVTMVSTDGREDGACIALIKPSLRFKVPQGISTRKGGSGI